MAKITTTIHDRVAVIRVQGRFDYQVRVAFMAFSLALAAAPGPKEIEVDLGAVDYIDSAALGCLLQLRAGAETHSKTIFLVGVSGVVARVLTIANFNRLFAYR